MAYQILKQYMPGQESVYVGAVGEEDQLEIYSTIKEAEDRKKKLETANPDRKFKIVETE